LSSNLVDRTNLAQTLGPDAKSIRKWDPYNSSIDTEDSDNFCDRAISDSEKRIRREQERMKIVHNQFRTLGDQGYREFGGVSTPEERSTVPRTQGGTTQPEVKQTQRLLPNGIPALLTISNRQRVGSYLLSSTPEIMETYTEETSSILSVPDDVSLEYSRVEPILSDDLCMPEDFYFCCEQQLWNRT